MEKAPEKSCRVCGCTEDHACRGGCEWIEPDLCSAHTNQLTIKEALEQGYHLYHDNDVDEHYHDLRELTESALVEFYNRGGIFYLAEKLPIPINTGDAGYVFENTIENTELAEDGGEACEDFLEEYKEEMQGLLDKISAKSVEERATRTYLLTEITLKPEPNNY